MAELLEPGDVFMFGEDLILSDTMQTVLANGLNLQEGGEPELMVLLTFEGRRNNGPDRMVARVALSPDAAFAPQGSLLSMLEALVGIEGGSKQ